MKRKRKAGGRRQMLRQVPRDEGSVIKSGYLWKKGEEEKGAVDSPSLICKVLTPDKNWKKRWFVLRPAHLAYYKSSAEYQLLRLLELSSVHSCTPVSLKRHDNAFGLISPVRTFYLQAKTSQEVQEWVAAIEEARLALRSDSTEGSTTASVPIPIPKRANSQPPLSVTPSPPAHMTIAHNLTSSESDDASPGITQIVERSYATHPTSPA